MAYRVNRKHFVFFRAASGLTLSSFSVTFLCDATATTCPLSLAEVAGGLYCCSYTPTLPGFYYLELSGNNVDVTNTVEIDTDAEFFGESNLVELTQNYAYNNQFVAATANAAQTKVMVFRSTDWTSGNTGNQYLVASTAVDATGNWLTPSLFVTHGTYHVVQSIAGNFVRTFAAFMVV